MKRHFCTLLLLLFTCIQQIAAEDGYRLWLRYDKIADKTLLASYKMQVGSVIAEGKSSIINTAKEELCNGLSGLFGEKLTTASSLQDHSVIIGTAATSPIIASLHLTEFSKLNKEGFTILTKNVQGKNCIVIAGNTDAGVLYGVFHFLQLLQTQKSIKDVSISSSPKIQIRILNHWDNMNRTVERGYAGFSIWKWHLLPGYIDQRYKDYARANASIGINGTVINNVNANVQIFTKEYLIKAAALADVFRSYGIKLYLAAKFSAPIEIGRLKTADPLDPEVKDWWKKKTDEIYSYIPDFGGFIVKANSEGQPGPQNYKRTHADGANMLADALAPHNGIVMWRAFVYSNETPTDRTKQSYEEFKPFDGQFKSNVIVQVKNGPLDFQPREPFHPLFGAMPKTPLLIEFQITQEYLGQATSLVYQAP
ncbi:MAG: alpha-glucuronidase family glycosyl hydrolase, partial [Sediminibacterium sp.]